MLTLTFHPTGTYHCQGLHADLPLLTAGLLSQTGCQDCPLFRQCKMSHWTEGDTQITDITALKAACKELCLAVEDKAHARGYNGQKLEAAHVIRCPGPYDVAVKQDASTGKYSFVTDWWGGHVAKAVGKNYGRLLQYYGVNKATAAAQRKGLKTQRRLEPNGEIKLLVTGAL